MARETRMAVSMARLTKRPEIRNTPIDAAVSLWEAGYQDGRAEVSEAVQGALEALLAFGRISEAEAQDIRRMLYVPPDE